MTPPTSRGRLSHPQSTIEHMSEAPKQEQGRGRRPRPHSPARLDPLAAHREHRSRPSARPRRPLGRPPPARVHPLRSGVHRAGVVSTRSPSPARVTPLVAEFCVAELGAVLGITTRVGEEAHRPRPRAAPPPPAAVGAGPRRAGAGLAGAGGRRGDHPLDPALTREAARFVDAQVAAVAGKIGPAQLDRLVAGAIQRYDLAETGPRRGPGETVRRRCRTRATSRSTTRTSTSTAPCGSRPRSTSPTDSTSTRRSPTAPRRRRRSARSESLDARRAKALGDLARTQTALDLHDRGRTASTRCRG